MGNAYIFNKKTGQASRSTASGSSTEKRAREDPNVRVFSTEAALRAFQKKWRSK